MDPTRVQALRVGISRTAGLLAAALGATVLVGYVLGIDALKHVVPGFASMKANTALCFLLAGLAAAQRSEEAATPARHRWGTALGLGAGTIGAATVLEYVAGVDLGIDQALFKDSLAGVATSAPGRMSPLTAIDFTLLGFAFAVLDRRPARALAPWVALPVAAVALFVLTSYLYGATFLATYTQMAVHTATGFLLLSVGLASARPNVGPAALLWDAGAIGSLARRLLPSLVVVPLALGWGRSLLADRAAVGEVEGITLFALAMTFVLGVVGWLLLRRLQASDRDRRAQELEREAAARALAQAVQRTDEAEIVTGRGAWEWDITKDRAVWSRGMYRLFGLDPATFTNSNDNFLAMVHPDDRARMGQAIVDALAKPGRFLQEYRLRRPDGRVIHVRGEGNVRTDSDGKARLLFGFVQDITEMKVLEERQRHADVAVRRAQERFQRIFESSPVPTLLSREDGRVEDANRAMIRMLGYEKDELLAPGFTTRQLYEDPQERDRILIGLRQAGAVRDRELGLRRKDGKVVQVLIALEFIDLGGNTTILSLFQDITDLKRAQKEREARIASEAELERLRRTDEFRTEFINSTAHELSTPMTPLLLGVASLRATLAANERAQHVLGTVERASERLRRVIGDMVNAADLQARAITLDRQRLNLTRQLAAAVAAHMDAAHRANVDLRLEGDSGLTVLADEHRVQLALGHLLGNALKFTPAGGHVVVSAERRDDHARIVIQDTGVGLTARQIEALWKPYSQAHDKSQRTDSGVGLGLYVTKGIVDLHGGEVGVVSPGPGKGSTFWISLPLAPGNVDPLGKAAKAAREAPPGEPRRNLNPGVSDDG